MEHSAGYHDGSRDIHLVSDVLLGQKMTQTSRGLTFAVTESQLGWPALPGTHRLPGALSIPQVLSSSAPAASPGPPSPSGDRALAPHWLRGGSTGSPGTEQSLCSVTSPWGLRAGCGAEWAGGTPCRPRGPCPAFPSLRGQSHFVILLQSQAMN